MLVVGLGNTLEICKELSIESYVHIETEETDPEKYENDFNVDDYCFDNVDEQYLFIIEAGSIESAATLKLLEAFVDYSVSICLLRDKTNLVTKQEKLLDKLVFGILQQKARAGVFQQLILIDVSTIVSFVSEEATIAEYDKLVTEQIVSPLQMYFQILEKKPDFDSLAEPHEASKIMTIGRGDFETGQENSLYELKYPRDKRYYYLLSNKSMNTPGVLKKIRTQIAGKQEKNLDISFGVYETPFEEDYVYFTTHSSYAWDEQEV